MNRPAWQRAANLADTSAVRSIEEAEPVPIRLDGPAGKRDIEISGLTWWGDRLLLLPQYPAFVSDSSPVIYSISRSDLKTAIETSVEGADTGAVMPQPLSVDIDDPRAVPGYQGFEALAVSGREVYATVEATGFAGGLFGMRAFLGRGVADSTRSPALAFAETSEIPVPVSMSNMGFEAIVVTDTTIIALFEANGANINPAPRAMQFTRDLRPLGWLPMSSLEYRLTDATALDHAGRFWVTNYLYEGDEAAMDPAPDSVALDFGVGSSHRSRVTVERLVELEVTDGSISRTETPPVWMTLTNGTGRNWEGVARFGDGFLLATDTFPETILAYVSRSTSSRPLTPDTTQSSDEMSMTSGR
ncbi:hypothetical protein [Longibacter salinarum]|uniref:hypothetical protein n=1 Tax=Longibacter salinarum TaxID=1850348 RepID=UPI000BEFB325|nr:hypothetical protein [Longibacter salinarum]